MLKKVEREQPALSNLAERRNSVAFFGVEQVGVKGEAGDELCP